MPFRVSKPVSVHNPYEWLPPSGEDSVQIRKQGTELVATVAFEHDSGTAANRELRFLNCCAFYFSAMPGVAALNLLADEKPFPLGHLIRWGKSELANEWSKHFARSYEHFVMYFLEANHVLDVVCESFMVGPELAVNAAQQKAPGDGFAAPEL